MLASDIIEALESYKKDYIFSDEEVALILCSSPLPVVDEYNNIHWFEI
jgi:hypothetical protein